MNLRASLPLALLGLQGLATVGCARTAEERQLDEMQHEIERIQASRDQADEDVSAEAEGRAAGGVPRRSTAESLGAPPTVALGDSVEDVDPDADPQDPGPRPSIRVIGSPRPVGRRSWREDQVEQTPDDGDASGASATRPSALDPQAKRAYDAAMAQLNAKQYDKALDSLAAFLVKWPDHPYADNAMYWRGEAYFARGDYARAAEQFDGVVARFPAGNKVPDALLKAGICQQKLGNPALAKAYFDRLTEQFGQSDAARRVPPVAVHAATPSNREDPR